MSEHYFCPGGCGGESETEKACEADHCPRHGVMMETCACADGQHGAEKTA